MITGEIYTYHDNILCVYGAMLYEKALITIYSYRNYVNRGHLNVVLKGGNGRRSLVEFDSMRVDIKNKVIKLFGDPYKSKAHNLKSYIQPDSVAAEFFSLYTKPNGKTLDEESQLIYRTNAEIYNAVDTLLQETKRFKESRGGRLVQKDFFKMISKAIGELPEIYKHSAGGYWRTVQKNFKRYKAESYPSIVHGGIGNANNRKVTDLIEKLVLSLYCQNNKPYANWVHEDYMRFVTGKIDIVDIKTGELFDVADFKDDKGQPIIISESTIWNIIRAPHNQPIIAQYRSGALEIMSKYRPHHHRHAPGWALSKISMDDRDLPRKMHNGNRVKAYYAYDVKSGTIIGASYDHSKKVELFTNCVRDMFRTIDKMGFGTPMEVEVEHHLVNHYKDDLFKAGQIFPFVRWANPGNAQEKWAETGHRLKKYGYEKRYQDGIGRFYAKLEANRTHQDKIFDEENNNYKEQTFDFEEIIADDQQIIDLFNNSLHPNQKEYKGMTRLEVLKHFVNPDLPMINKALLAKYIGVSVDTTIRRNQYVRVNYKNFQIELESLKNLKPNDYGVTAYYLPHQPKKVYLYQGNQLICEAHEIDAYSTARSEWDDADKQSYQNQAKYVSEFDSMVKRRKKQISRVELIEKEAFVVPDQEVEIVQHTVYEDDYADDFDLSDYDPESILQKARENL